MKRIFMVMALLLSLLVAGMVCAEEGGGTSHCYYISNLTVLPFSKDTMRINYDSGGIISDDSGKGLFHNGSQHIVGGMNIVKGVITESGFMIITLISGDKVFGTYESSGNLGTPTVVKGTVTYVGGTGKFKDITGGGEFTRYSLQPPYNGKGAATSTVKSHWKIP